MLSALLTPLERLSLADHRILYRWLSSTFIINPFCTVFETCAFYWLDFEAIAHVLLLFRKLPKKVTTRPLSSAFSAYRTEKTDPSPNAPIRILLGVFSVIFSCIYALRILGWLFTANSCELHSTEKASQNWIGNNKKIKFLSFIGLCVVARSPFALPLFLFLFYFYCICICGNSSFSRCCCCCCCICRGIGVINALSHANTLAHSHTQISADGRTHTERGGGGALSDNNNNNFFAVCVLAAFCLTAPPPLLYCFFPLRTTRAIRSVRNFFQNN